MQIEHQQQLDEYEIKPEGELKQEMSTNKEKIKDIKKDLAQNQIEQAIKQHEFEVHNKLNESYKTIAVLEEKLDKLTKEKTLLDTNIKKMKSESSELKDANKWIKGAKEQISQMES